MAKKLGRGMNALLKKETSTLLAPELKVQSKIHPKAAPEKSGEKFGEKSGEKSGRKNAKHPAAREALHEAAHEHAAAVVDSDLDPAAADEDISRRVLELPLKAIQANKAQPRSYFNEEKIHELAQSIKNQGMLQPLLVMERDGGYVIVAGERRFRAAKHLGLTTVPAIVLSMSDEEVFEAALVENLQREDLNPIETALSFQNLLRVKNVTHFELAQLIGVSRAVITNALRLLMLPKNIQQALEQNRISSSHARLLLSLESEEAQQQALKEILEERLSVHDFSRRYGALLERDTHKKKKAGKKIDATQRKKDAFLSDYQAMLIEHFGTNVQIFGSVDSGSIKLDFYDKKDFERILHLLGIKKKIL